MKSVLVLDMGNSGLKGALYSGGKIVDRARFDFDDSFAAAPSLARKFSPEAVAFCSVVPAWTSRFTVELEKCGVEDVIQITAGSGLPFEILVEEPDAVGADRVCAAAGALAAGAEEAVIVDAGTAVTVDLLSVRGYEGGSIFPGISTLLKSLGGSAASLPEIVCNPGEDRFPIPPGRSTSEAMRAGSFWGLVGAVDKLVKITAGGRDSRPDIYLTGGAAPILADIFEFPFIHEPDLVFMGLYAIFLDIG